MLSAHILHPILVTQYFTRRCRNGGHISPNVYDDYSVLKKKHGASLALQIIRFRLAHIATLIAVAEEEGLLVESQARVVEEFDVYAEPSMFEDAKNELDGFIKEVKEDADKFRVLERREEMEVRAFSRIRVYKVALTRLLATSVLV